MAWSQLHRRCYLGTASRTRALQRQNVSNTKPTRTTLWRRRDPPPREDAHNEIFHQFSFSTLNMFTQCTLPYLSVAINTQIISLSPISIPSQNPIQTIHHIRTPYKRRQSKGTTSKRIPQPTTIPLKKKGQRQLPFQPQTPPGTEKEKGNCVMTAPDGAYILNFPMYP